MFKHFKKESRSDWGRELPDQTPLTMGEIQHGAILRIADATEAMAKNHVALQNEAARYKRWYDEEHANSAKLTRQNAALRGQITKLRKRLSVG